jgi:hypothetical protein
VTESLKPSTGSHISFKSLYRTRENTALRRAPAPSRFRYNSRTSQELATNFYPCARSNLVPRADKSNHPML